MRTQFSAAQLADPDFRSSEQILRRCVHCGFCTATCPTYVLLGDELDGPRGRIYLIKEMLERGGAPAPQTVKHIDRCLSCLSCVTTCPSGVDYMHLVDHARDYIEQHFTRPPADRVLRRLLGLILSRPTLLRAALHAARILRPLAMLWPARLRSALLLAPHSLPRAQRPQQPRLLPAQGAPRARVALLSGCAQSVVAPAINAAAVRFLNRQGVEVVIAPSAGCCGALTHHLGQARGARHLAAANITAWLREREVAGLDAIISTTSGCGTMLKDYAHLFRGEEGLMRPAAQVSALALDISEYIAGLGDDVWKGVVSRQAPPLRVAYQSPCSMQHGQKLHALPMQLLSAAGFEVSSLPEAHLCCGSAGTYNILQPQIAAQLRERKQALITAQAPQVVASGNIGCMMQLSPGLGVPMVHTIELLDWATGGPAPPQLAGWLARSADPSQLRQP